MDKFKEFRTVCLMAAIAFALSSCASSEKANVVDNKPATADAVRVGVTKPVRKPLRTSLTLSAELVPFQQIDVYAKVSGYIKKLDVDYGTHVKKDQVMAVLEIPELEIQVKQDEADIKHAQDEVARAQNELKRSKAQETALHLAYDRLDTVSKTQKGLIAQQELDDAQAKALAGAAQVDSSQSALDAANSQLATMQVKRQHDQALFDYSKITAPFAGVVTKRFANYGALMQAGTSSSTQAMPLVTLAEDDVFRLSIPIPESYVRYIKLGDMAKVSVPSLGKTFTGDVRRFSEEVAANTRTMHTEVDVKNTDGSLFPGVYAEATLSIQQKENALTVPLQAVNQVNDQATVFVVGQGNKVEERHVTLGIQTASDAEITSGLSADDQIVISDRSGLKAGQSVTPKTIEPAKYDAQGEK